VNPARSASSGLAQGGASAGSAGHVGIGLRHPHHAALLAAAPRLPFVEVHSENFFGDGGAALGVLDKARSLWPVSLHGVGLSLGSASGLDPWHLDRLAALAERIDPVRVSDHASFARAPRSSAGAPVHAADLLPVAFTPAALSLMAANVQHVQDRLRRPILVENLSAYLHWADSTLAEPAFFNELCRRTGCGLLLDVNNLVVNALNEGRSEADAAAAACRWVDAIEPQHVGEIHLAGYHAGPDIVVDDHGSAVHEPVWQVFRHATQRLGPVPTLVEWDTDLPAPEVLLAEAAKAERMFS
jgi:uncharacterized protein